MRIGERVFLEVERFDRAGTIGRRGLVTLRALDREFAGRLGTWTETTAALVSAGVLDRSLLSPVRWLERFGRFIADADMHAANLSFHVLHGRIEDLAPAYDRLPMLYAPVAGQLVDRTFEPPLPTTDDVAEWKSARLAAIEFWARASEDVRISGGFRAVARSNEAALRSLDGVAARIGSAPAT